MDKQVGLFVREHTMNASENDLKHIGKYGVNLWYGFNNYDKSVEQIMRLKEAVKKDYPDIEDKNMFINIIESYESNRHARQMMLVINITIEEFIRLKNEGKLEIL